jgi:hypothetical protein
MYSPVSNWYLDESGLCVFAFYKNGDMESAWKALSCPRARVETGMMMLFNLAYFL